MKQTIPHGDTHETREGTALHEAIGAAVYWKKRAEKSYHVGFLVGLGVNLLLFGTAFALFIVENR